MRLTRLTEMIYTYNYMIFKYFNINSKSTKCQLEINCSNVQQKNCQLLKNPVDNQLTLKSLITIDLILSTVSTTKSKSFTLHKKKYLRRQTK